MVTYKPDNLTLFFTRDGKEYSADPMSDWMRYSVFEATRSAQVDTVGVNANALSNYHTALGNYNANTQAGRDPHTAPPVKPKLVTVFDPDQNAEGSWVVGA